MSVHGCAWKCIPVAISSGMDISEVPGCHLLWQMCVQSGSQKLLQSLVSHELTAYLSGVILFILNEWWPYYQKDVGQIVLNLNSRKHSFINIWGLCLNFVDCESFLESNSPDILALCETNLDDSIDLGNFSVRGHLALIQKDSTTYMHGSQFMWRKDFPLNGTFCRFILMFSTGFTSLSVLLHLPQLTTFFVFIHSFWFYFM